MLKSTGQSIMCVNRDAEYYFRDRRFDGQPERQRAAGWKRRVKRLIKK